MAISRTSVPTPGYSVPDPGNDRDAGAEILRTIARAAQVALAGERLNITDLKRNPGRLIADIEARGPMLLGDGKRRDGPEAVLMSAGDARLLAGGLMSLLDPGLVTGRDLARRFTHDGPAADVALNPPAEEAYALPVLSDVLGGSWSTEMESPQESELLGGKDELEEVEVRVKRFDVARMEDADEDGLDKEEAFDVHYDTSRGHGV